MNTPKKPTPVPAAAYEVREIDLATERQKLLSRDGLTAADLDTMITMKRGTAYDDVIRAYYHGQDVGFNAGMLNTMKAARPAWVIFLAGFLTLPILWLIWKCFVFLYYVSTFTPPPVTPE